jgi:hypothetical protein
VPFYDGLRLHNRHAFRTVGASRYSSVNIKRSVAPNVCLLGECRLSMLI